MSSATFLQTSGIVRLTKDPKVVQSGEHTICNLSLVSNYEYRRDGKVVKEPPTFLEAEAYEGAAKVLAANLHKGDRVFLQGRLKLESWLDKGSQQKRSAHKLVIRDFKFIEPKAADDEARGEAGGDDVPY